MAKKTDLGPILITDKDGNEIDLNEHPLLHRALTHAGKLWIRCEKKFMDAMDGSDRKQIQVSFGVIINTKEKMPVVDTTISFKDKTKESGMSVIKTYRLSETEELEDPEAPPLPGVDMEAAKKGRLAEGQAASEGEANGEGETEGGKKKRGRPRKNAPAE
jgi:hypothetical protein